MSKPKQITKTIGGIEFTFQHPGIRKTLQINDTSRGDGGKFLSEQYYSQLMEHVIVNPKTNWEFWDEDENFELLDEVMATAATFLNTRKG